MFDPFRRVSAPRGSQQFSGASSSKVASGSGCVVPHARGSSGRRRQVEGAPDPGTALPGRRRKTPSPNGRGTGGWGRSRLDALGRSSKKGYKEESGERLVEGNPARSRPSTDRRRFSPWGFVAAPLYDGRLSRGLGEPPSFWTSGP